MKVIELLNNINKAIEDLNKFRFTNIVQLENELNKRIPKIINHSGVKELVLKDLSYICFMIQNKEIELFKIKKHFNLCKQNKKLNGFNINYIKCDFCDRLDNSILEIELLELHKYLKNKYLNSSIESYENEITKLENRIAELKKDKIRYVKELKI
jgi:hypothetical protein